MPMYVDRPYSSTPLLALYDQIRLTKLFAIHPTLKNVQVDMGAYTTELLNSINLEFSADRLRLTELEANEFTGAERDLLNALKTFHNTGLHNAFTSIYADIKTAVTRAQTVDMHVAMSNITDAITDTNIGVAAYFYATEAKAITALKFTLLESTTAGVFSVMMKINDVDAFAAPVAFTIGSPTASYTIPLNATHGENVIDLPANAKVTLHIVSAGTGAKAAVATFTLKNASTYTNITPPTYSDV